MNYPESGTPVPHAPDIHRSNGPTDDRQASRRPDHRPDHRPVRGLCRHGRGCRGGGLCAVAPGQGCCPGPVDPGPAIVPGNRAALCWRSGRAQRAHAAPCPPARRADRGRRGVALQGPVGGGGRDLWQPARAGLHRNQTSGPAGRGDGGALLADPAWWGARSQRRARPLAGRIIALGPEPGRCNGPRRSALAGRAVPVARQATRPLGGTT